MNGIMGSELESAALRLLQAICPDYSGDLAAGLNAVAEQVERCGLEDPQWASIEARGALLVVGK